MEKKRLGEILVAENLITDEQLQEALKEQKKLNMKLGNYLEQKGLITEQVLIKAIQKQLGLSLVDVDKIYIEEETIKMIPEEIARKYNVMPVSFINGSMLLAMSDPLDYFTIEDIKKIIGFRVVPAIAEKNKIHSAIQKYYGKSIAEKAVGEFVKQNQYNLKEKEMDVDTSNSPILKFINTVIETAIRMKASDIHIEPDEDNLRVRYRIDGVLRENIKTNGNINQSVVNRIKIMCNLDITKNRIPQDGKTFFELDGKKIDLRVSTLPITEGEKVVIRILDKSNFTLNRESIGLNEEELNLYQNIISKPNGIILVTGPTGSGKTTTLYTMLNEYDNVKQNIITIEDPVEYNFKGINQVQVNSNTGMTFAEGLKSILRQDPDIIMVGEIRDSETAKIAIRSALTGHLVLSSIHTNDSLSTIARLIDMGIEPFLLSSTLSGVIAQRLVRKICPHCKESFIPTEGEKKILNTNNNISLYKGKGCSFCDNTGYKGRTAIFEILEVDTNFKKIIESSNNYTELEELANKKGMKTLKDKCVSKVLDGTTTIEELLRVTYL